MSSGTTYDGNEPSKRGHPAKTHSEQDLPQADVREESSPALDGTQGIGSYSRTLAGASIANPAGGTLSIEDLRILPLPAKQVLYVRESIELGLSRGHLVSNESDFWKQPIDTRPADIFVGFGNNNVYDLAMRRNAKTMVIVDHDGEVLRAHEYLYKPLAMIARSPGEFISMLTGYPVPRHAMDGPIDFVFAEIARSIVSEHPIFPNPERMRYAHSVAERIGAHPALTGAHAEFVRNHLLWLAAPQQIRPSIEGVFSDFQLQEDGTAFMLGRLFARYSTLRLASEGAPPELVLSPNYSILSSPEAFRWLQNIYSDNQVFYVLADIADGRAYERIGDLARASGQQIGGLYLTNITDIRNETDARGNALLYRVTKAAMRGMPVDSSFTIYRTCGTGADHQYEQHQLSQPSDLHRSLRLYGSPTAGIEAPSDFAQIMTAMTFGELAIVRKPYLNFDFRFDGKWLAQVVPWPDRMERPASIPPLVAAINFHSVTLEGAPFFTHFVTEAERRIFTAGVLLCVCFAAPLVTDCEIYRELHGLDPEKLKAVIRAESRKLHNPEPETVRAIDTLLRFGGNPSKLGLI